MKPLFIYLIIINAAGLLIMLIDKHNAIHKLHRIPERGLLLVAITGGSLGCMAGMYLFRHKTRHLKFSLGLPAILAVQLIILFLAMHHFS